MPNNQDSLLTEKEVIEYLAGKGVKVTPSGIYFWLKKGLFPLPVQPSGRGGKKYYHRDEVEMFAQGKFN